MTRSECQRSEHSPPRRSGTSPGGRRTESRRDDERAQHRCPARQPASRYSSAATRQCCRDGLRPPCHRPTWLAQALPRTSRPPVRRGSIDGADSTTDADVPVRAAMSFNGDRVAHTESSRRPQGDSGRDERRSPEESPDQHGEFGDRSHLGPSSIVAGLGVVWVVSRGAAGARGATVLCGARGPRAGSPWMPPTPRTTICRHRGRSPADCAQPTVTLGGRAAVAPGASRRGKAHLQSNRSGR